MLITKSTQKMIITNSTQKMLIKNSTQKILWKNQQKICQKKTPRDINHLLLLVFLLWQWIVSSRTYFSGLEPKTRIFTALSHFSLKKCRCEENSDAHKTAFWWKEEESLRSNTHIHKIKTFPTNEIFTRKDFRDTTMFLRRTAESVQNGNDLRNKQHCQFLTDFWNPKNVQFELMVMGQCLWQQRFIESTLSFSHFGQKIESITFLHNWKKIGEKFQCCWNWSL